MRKRNDLLQSALIGLLYACITAAVMYVMSSLQYAFSLITANRFQSLHTVLESIHAFYIFLVGVPLWWVFRSRARDKKACMSVFWLTSVAMCIGMYVIYRIFGNGLDLGLDISEPLETTVIFVGLMTFIFMGDLLRSEIKSKKYRSAVFGLLFGLLSYGMLFAINLGLGGLINLGFLSPEKAPIMSALLFVGAMIFGGVPVFGIFASLSASKTAMAASAWFSAFPAAIIYGVLVICDSFYGCLDYIADFVVISNFVTYGVAFLIQTLVTVLIVFFASMPKKSFSRLRGRREAEAEKEQTPSPIPQR